MQITSETKTNTLSHHRHRHRPVPDVGSNETVFCFLFYFGQQVADPYLLKARAAQCVDRTLTELNARQLTAADEWERWNARQQTDAKLNDIMAANMEV